MLRTQLPGTSSKDPRRKSVANFWELSVPKRKPLKHADSSQSSARADSASKPRPSHSTTTPLKSMQRRHTDSSRPSLQADDASTSYAQPDVSAAPGKIQRRNTSYGGSQTSLGGRIKRLATLLTRSKSLPTTLSPPPPRPKRTSAASPLEEPPETPSTGVSSIFDIEENPESPTTGTSSAFGIEQRVESPIDGAFAHGESERKRPPSTIFLDAMVDLESFTAEIIFVDSLHYPRSSSWF